MSQPVSVLTGDFTLKSLRPCNLSKCTKSDLKTYFENSYNLNESIFTALKDESCFYRCPDHLRLPLIFYYGHTASVYMNKLILSGLTTDRVDFDLETLFETGVDEMSWDDVENYRMGGSFKWPALADVVDYRRKVRQHILKMIDKQPLNLPITMDSPWWALVMGMEHERIHLETSSVLIRQMPISMVKRPAGWKYGPRKTDSSVLENTLIPVKSETVTLGKPFDFPSYGWDNEYGSWTVTVPPFEASKYIVTNRQFLKFVEEGCYSNSKYWRKEGWEWVLYRKVKHPIFWVCTKGCKSGCGSNLASYSHCTTEGFQTTYEMESDEMAETNCSYRYRTFCDIVEMPWDWPVEVNYHEAKAYCNWLGPGYRLPSEAEHHVMRAFTEKHPLNGIENDIIFKNEIESNVNLQYGSSTPVNMYSPNALGFHDVFGNVWEWVEDHFNGLSGFKTQHFYDDFSSPCFDGRHNIILGGSWVSTGVETSHFARYSFRRHFFQHLGFRIVKNVQQNGQRPIVPIRLVDTNVFVLGMGVPDNELLLNTSEYQVLALPSTNHQFLQESESMLLIQFQEEYLNNCDDFLAEFSLNKCNKYSVSRNRCLHLGCGIGRTAFEFTRTFQEVIGVDYCGRFIDAAQKIQAKGLSSFHPILPDLRKAKFNEKFDKDKVIFKQLTWLPNEIGTFDLVVITFLDRVTSSKAWLLRLWEILNDLGILIIASTTDWNQDKLGTIFNERLQLLEHAEKLGSINNKRTAITIWKKSSLENGIS